jgi:hypothetical protein
LIACLLAGCATGNRDGGSARPQNGVEEYRELTNEALTALNSALGALDKVTPPTGRPSTNEVAAFAHEVQHLQVKSLRVRARAQAIQARGDAYFADWAQSVVRITNPQVRELAERHHTELEAKFSNIKLYSEQAGAAYRPFLAGLRELSTELQYQPDKVASDATRELMRTTREHGAQVLRELSAVNDELQAIAALLTLAKPVAHK